MNFFLGSDWFVVPAFGICIFIFSYLMSDRVLNFLYKKSLGNREKVIELLDRMFIEVDKKKITMSMLLISFGVGALLFLLFWPNVVLGILVGGGVTVLGWSLPPLIMNQLWEKRSDALVNQMVDGMTIMSNGIKAGLSITQSMERVVENMGGPLSKEFGLVLNKIRLGMPLEEALNELGDRISRPDLQMFVAAVNILKETGGNLAETFRTVVTTIRERQKIEKKIEAMTAQGMMQGIIMVCVPFVLMGVFLAIDPSYIMPLFTKPLGWVALIIMLVLQVIGGVLMKKIVTIKV